MLLRAIGTELSIPLSAFKKNQISCEEFIKKITQKIQETEPENHLKLKMIKPRLSFMSQFSISMIFLLSSALVVFIAAAVISSNVVNQAEFKNAEIPEWKKTLTYYFLKSEATLGYARAQTYLGFFYLRGLDGLKANKEQANYWLQKAAAQGDEDAIKASKNLTQLSDHESEALKKLLS